MFDEWDDDSDDAEDIAVEEPAEPENESIGGFWPARNVVSKTQGNIDNRHRLLPLAPSTPPPEGVGFAQLEGNIGRSITASTAESGRMETLAEVSVPEKMSQPLLVNLAALESSNTVNSGSFVVEWGSGGFQNTTPAIVIKRALTIGVNAAWVRVKVTPIVIAGSIKLGASVVFGIKQPRYASGGGAIVLPLAAGATVDQAIGASLTELEAWSDVNVEVQGFNGLTYDTIGMIGANQRARIPIHPLVVSLRYINRDGIAGNLYPTYYNEV